MFNIETYIVNQVYSFCLSTGHLFGLGASSVLGVNEVRKEYSDARKAKKEKDQEEINRMIGADREEESWVAEVNDDIDFTELK